MIKILVVDDELDVKQLFLQRFRKELREGEFVFHFAYNGEEALQYIRTLEPFDLVMVLSDINMPGMTGIELLQIICIEKPTLKVMMISAYGDEKNRNKATEIGASDFVTKPIDFAVLKSKIMACVGKMNNL